MLRQKQLDKAVLALKGMEAFAKVADGKATKIIIPSELQNVVTLSELFHESSKKEVK